MDWIHARAIDRARSRAPGERTMRDRADRVVPRSARVAAWRWCCCPGVQYLTGQVFDLAPLIAAARRAGRVVGLDLAHAIGNVPLCPARLGRRFRRVVQLQVSQCRARRHRRLFRSRAACAPPRPAALRRLVGTRSRSTRFAMGPDFDPIPGAEGWQISNPPILSAAPLLASLERLSGAGIDAAARQVRGADRLPAPPARGALPRAVEIITPRPQPRARLPAVPAARAAGAPCAAVPRAPDRCRHGRRLARAGYHSRGPGAALQPFQDVFAPSMALAGGPRHGIAGATGEHRRRRAGRCAAGGAAGAARHRK